jgi:ABC-type nitrate/sulfonate/bicarbonate transport system ATPase subunit
MLPAASTWKVETPLTLSSLSTVRLIAGLPPQFPATSGEILVFGKPVASPGADRGMVFQDYTSFDNRTVEDNIAFGLEC